ncbi:uncharacterized protein LOC110462274 [Mizuhopecten yessoensis]|uniref:Uncharacterized protein n=1 Tax=Mizuhopecten yessoensis TaxID=6573 RepID=A0A210PYG6_MIZYE|nr:uncharacterized protein LOC110462274 [Mizuhopecten yessoensis]OWF41521.1 hypothetical protein KP79_PYT22536 [Mizuhopecten yessoensis]
MEKTKKDRNSMADHDDTQSLYMGSDFLEDDNVGMRLTEGHTFGTTVNSSDVLSTLSLRQLSIQDDLSSSCQYDDVTESDFYETLQDSSRKNALLMKTYSHVPVQLSFHGEFSAALTTDDERCWLFGAADLTDGRIVLLDYNNTKLKVFDQSLKPVVDITLSGSCGGLCAVDTDRVAVTCNTGIQFYSIRQTSIRVDQYLELGQESDGITYDTAMFAVSCSILKMAASIKLLDRQGHIKADIKETNVRNGVIFSSNLLIHYIKKCVYVSDWGERKGVVSLSFTGTVLWTCPVGGLPRGLSLINSGILVVSNPSRRGIHQVKTEDGRPVQTIDTDDLGVIHASLVLYRKASKNILVTQLGSDICKILE